MKLKEWALVAEITGAVGIIISLVFVGYQIQQGTEETSLNTRAIEASAFQDLTSQILNLNLSVIETPDLSEIFFKQTCSKEDLSVLDSQRMAQIGIYSLRHGDMAFYMYQQGLIDEQRLRNSLAIVLTTLASSEIARNLWNNSKQVYSPDFVAYVDATLPDSANIAVCLAGPPPSAE